MSVPKNDAMRRLDREKQSLADAYDEPPTFLEIEVSDAQVHGEGPTRYVDYAVSMNTNLPFFPKSESRVRRRYSDFVWLRKEMEGAVAVELPSLPSKAIFKRLISKQECFGEQFIEKRREGLEHFMNRLASHPLVQNQEGLHKFLLEETLHLQN